MMAEAQRFDGSSVIGSVNASGASITAPNSLAENKAPTSR